MKQLIILISILLLTTSSFSQKYVNKHKLSTNDATVIGKLTYPYKFKYEGNPLSRMHGAADPDVHVWDGVVWMYCSQDRKMDSTKHKTHYDAMDGYHVFSSKDMINWTDHGEIFNSYDVPWSSVKNGFLWAPGAARANGKYYLYYPIKDKNNKWAVGVAVGDTPVGPFKDSGKPLNGLDGIDPCVFIDDDGQAYIYNNHAVVAKLKPNMIELAEEPRKIDYAPQEIEQNDTLRFCEGSYMHKKDGIYYYSYTNWKNKTLQGYYAMGKSPYGPFEWKGAIGPEPADAYDHRSIKESAQDHHSIIKFKNQWYYFYHISSKDFPKYKESQGRIACFDKLYYNQDGTIHMIKHTLQPSLNK